MRVINTPDELFRAYHKIALLGVLLGDYRYVHAMRIAGMVWQVSPIDFPDFASVLVDGQDPRAACWALAETLKDRVGAHDAYWAAFMVDADFRLRPNYTAADEEASVTQAKAIWAAINAADNPRLRPKYAAAPKRKA